MIGPFRTPSSLFAQYLGSVDRLVDVCRRYVCLSSLFVPTATPTPLAASLRQMSSLHHSDFLSAGLPHLGGPPWKEKWAPFRQSRRIRTLPTRRGGETLWHQWRGVSSNGGAPNGSQRIAMLCVEEKKEMMMHQKSPPLICVARRSCERVYPRKDVVDMQRITRKESVEETAKMIVTERPPVERRLILTMRRATRVTPALVHQTQSAAHPMDALRRTIISASTSLPDAMGNSTTAPSVATSPPTPPPAFPHTAQLHAHSSRGDSSGGEHDEEVLVFNIFTHRVVRASAASVRALAILGIGVRRHTHELDVTDPNALAQLRARLRRQEVRWPTAWRSAAFQRVHSAILHANGEEAAVAGVQSVLQELYTRVRSRSGIGVVGHAEMHPPNPKPPAHSQHERDAAEDHHEERRNHREESAGTGTSRQDRLLTYNDLNKEQQRVVRFALEGYHTYIGGGAGTGKSLLLRVLRQEFARQGLTVAMTATTGIAAARIDGVTLHHCFGVTIHGDFTRRAELRAYDVIIIDEVSMLSRDLFETLDYHLRRANAVDLPFGGVQIVLCGDFLQLGAIAAQPLIHSPLFRRNFSMLKLQQIVRQESNGLFAQQLQELRRGTVPHDIHDTISFIPPSASKAITAAFTEGAVRLLPTNSEVDSVNMTELRRLPGGLIEFPTRPQSPSLAGRWSSTYFLEIVGPIEQEKFIASIQTYVFEFVRMVPGAAEIALTRLGQQSVVIYKLFVDAFALRVRIPVELDDRDVERLARHLRALEKWLPAQGFQVRLRDIVQAPDGLHTDTDEYTLMHYAQHSPMSNPLRLKIGARVMLRANLAPGLVNGSLGVVVGFKPLRVESLPRYIRDVPGRVDAVESYKDCLRHEYNFETAIAPEVDFGGGRVLIVPPTTFYVGGMSNTNHYRMGILALPLSLAYAFTVHKVQGLTLVGRVHLELSRMWPCEHLLYVAMSRVRNPEQLSISAFHNGLVRCASDCLLFDDSLPSVESVQLLPHFVPATWQRSPGRRKAELRKKQEDRLLARVAKNESKGIPSNRSESRKFVGHVTQRKIVRE